MVWRGPELGSSAGLRRLGTARNPRAMKPTKRRRYAQAAMDAAAGGARFAASYARPKANGCAPPAVRVRPDSVRCCGTASHEAAPCQVTAAGGSVRPRSCARPASRPMLVFQARCAESCCFCLALGRVATHRMMSIRRYIACNKATARCSSPLLACTPSLGIHHSCMSRAQVVLGRTLRPGTRVSWCGPHCTLPTCTLVVMCGPHAPTVQGVSHVMLCGCGWARASRR